MAATVFGRIGGWLNWGATLRSFGRAINNGYDHLIGLSHAWHTDRPSGEVIATLETSTWAFVELIDAMVWGILRISVTTLGAIVVLGIVAWPVALVMAALVGVFVLVLFRRLDRVVAAEKAFSDAALAGDRRGGRHHRQPDDGAVAGGRGPREAARRPAGRRLVAGRPSGPAGLHDHPDPDGVGHGLLQLGVPWPWAWSWRCITSPRPGWCT